jgi:Fe-S cluster assembly protein SufB
MSAELVQHQALQEMGNDYKYGFSDKEDYMFKSGRGLTREIVEKISAMKNEPEWMLKFRLRALDIFLKKPMPTWGNCDLLKSIDFDNIFYYIRPSERSEKNWDDVPESSKPSIAWASRKQRENFSQA